MRIVIAYLLAVFTSYGIAAIAATQSVMARLQDMGVAVPLADRFAATLHDLGGMATSYLPIIAVGFLLAFPVAALVCRWLPGWRRIGYPLAGAAAIAVVLLLLQQLLNITPIAAARSTGGFAIQVFAGLVGGWLFVTVLGRRNGAS